MLRSTVNPEPPQHFVHGPTFYRTGPNRYRLMCGMCGELCFVDATVFSRASRAILKPNDDYGGHGICLGKNVSEGEWEAMMKVALAGDYVVQEIIELHREDFPVFDERGWSLQSMYVDTNPFLFRGEAHGAMVRLSGSPIVNVTSGGGETGFFVIEGAV